MKKLMAVILTVLLISTLCGAANSGKVKTGLAVITELNKSTDAGEKPGLAEIDSTVVAVTVDSKGKIVKCVIDMVQSKINFDASGKLTTPMDTTFPTKNELGEGYGMKKASKIGKEWNEQAAALAKYVVGKTVREIKGIAMDADKHATGSDLKTSVTISIGGYIEAIEKAVAQAQALGASSSDELGLGVVTNMSHSVNAGEKPGLAQGYSTYIAITKDSKGKITSCLIDASQGNVNFNTSGKITTDLKTRVKTKNELGEAYGLKKASKIGKEWNEQAAAFAKYVTGKTLDQVANIAVNKEGHATGSDLLTSVTMSIIDFQAALAKAAAKR
jgi:ribosomal protein L7Ae-like RNA K-turn-binding protein